MKARIVRIGNSRGVRLPKPLLEEAGLGEQVELHAEPGRIVITAARPRRAGWAAAARAMRERAADGLLETPAPTRFDATDWEWS